MNEYTLKVPGGKACHLNKIGGRHVKVKIGSDEATVNVNDLAMVVKECLPIETAEEMFGNVDEREIRSGKVKIKLKAERDIRKGEYIVSSLDINKYLDKQGNPTGVRTTSFGFVY